MDVLERYKLSDVDPFLCTCGPCRRFWKDNFNDASELLSEPAMSRASGSATVPSHNHICKIGDRVLVQGKYQGTVKFVGVVDDSSIAPQLYVGVKLDDNVNSVHNGVFKGKRYFHCPRGHGAMVRYTEVTPLKSYKSTPPISGNYMFPSWDDVRKRRGDRYKKLVEIYRNAGIEPPDTVIPPAPGYSPPKHRIEPLIHVGDPYDIGLRDREQKSIREKRHQESFREDREKQELRKAQQHFEGHSDSDRMVQTLLKLQRAYKEGEDITKKRSNWDLQSNNSDSDD
ncbi:uncharacterized protein LOC117337046 isoform X1 [Pecten maximus]|uniref:uncharacterized protein LOC117337046 isoform X1 n=1 Tax=Pecten maximus TaxID=6579 RepID=UPI00145919E5|nr:uncharacterized protein LOC117337046 isoform X1 [Pecten maximus]